MEKIILERPLKAVIDCGNASACLAAPQIFKELGIDTKGLYCDVDGNFPNHHPDPTEDRNLVALVNEIKSGEYDFGVAVLDCVALVKGFAFGPIPSETRVKIGRTH